MINLNTPFLNADNRTISREWLLFFQTLDIAVGGTNIINITPIPDAQIQFEVEDANDASGQVPDLISQVDSLYRAEYGPDDLAGLALSQEVVDSQVLIVVQEDPAGFATSQSDSDNQLISALQEFPTGLDVGQSASDAQILAFVQEEPTGFATDKDVKSNNVLIWMDV